MHAPGPAAPMTDRPAKGKLSFAEEGPTCENEPTRHKNVDIVTLFWHKHEHWANHRLGAVGRVAAHILYELEPA